MQVESSKKTDAAAAGQTSLQYLTFSLSDETFAMDIRTVREIIQHAQMTVVPLMPSFVRGVINLRGAVVPVIDLQSRFGRDSSSVGKKTCIIIFDASSQGEKQELGLMVDSVSEVIDIADASIEPTPSFGTTIAREFIRGLGKVENDFVPIIDTDRALSLEEMANLVERQAR